MVYYLDLPFRTKSLIPLVTGKVGSWGPWAKSLSGNCPQAKVYLTQIIPPSQGQPTYNDWSSRGLKAQSLCFEEGPSQLQRFTVWQLNPLLRLHWSSTLLSVHSYAPKGVDPRIFLNELSALKFPSESVFQGNRPKRFGNRSALRKLL